MLRRILLGFQFVAVFSIVSIAACSTAAKDVKGDENDQGEAVRRAEINENMFKGAGGSRLVEGSEIMDAYLKSIQSHLRDKIVVLYVASHYCPPCEKAFPDVVDAVTKLKDQGEDVEFLIVDASSTEELKKLGMKASAPTLRISYKHDQTDYVGSSSVQEAAKRLFR